MEVVGYLMIAAIFVGWYGGSVMALGYKGASLMVLGIIALFGWIALSFYLINGGS